MTEEIDLLLKLLVDKNSFSQGQKAVGELEKSIQEGLGELSQQFSQTAQKAVTGIADPQQRRDALQQLASLKQMTAANLSGARSTGEVKQQVQAMSAALERARADADQYANSLKNVDNNTRSTARSSKMMMMGMTGFTLAMTGQQMVGLGQAALSPISQYTKYAGSSDASSARFLAAQRDMEQAMLRIGRVMTDQLTPYMESFADSLEGLAGMIEENPTLSKIIIGGSVGMIGLGIALKVIGGLMYLLETAGITGGATAATTTGGAAVAGGASLAGPIAAAVVAGLAQAGIGGYVSSKIDNPMGEAAIATLPNLLGPAGMIFANGAQIQQTLEMLSEWMGKTGDVASETAKEFILSEAAVKAFAQGQKELRKIDENYAADRARTEADYEKRRSEIVEQYGRQRAQIEADYERERAQIVEDFSRQQSQSLEDFQRQQKQAAQDFSRQQQQAAEDQARQLADLDADYQQRRADALADYQRGEADARAKYQDDSQKAQEDYYDRLRDAEREHGYNVEDLGAKRDALGLARENRRYADEQKALAEDYADRQKELDQQFEQERQQRAEEYQLQMVEAQANYEQQRAERIADYERQQAERAEEFAMDAQRRADEFALQQQRAQEEFAERLQQMDEQHARELAELQAANQSQLAELQKANSQKLAELRKSYEQERTERVAALKTQIAEMTGIWDAGFEQWRVAATAFFESLKAQAGAPAAAGSKAEGGYVYPGLWNLHAGEYVMNASTVSTAERMVGGNLSGSSILSAMGGGNRLNQQIAINAPISAADRAWFKQTMRQIFEQSTAELYR